MSLANREIWTLTYGMILGRSGAENDTGLPAKTIERDEMSAYVQNCLI